MSEITVERTERGVLDAAEAWMRARRTWERSQTIHYAREVDRAETILDACVYAWLKMRGKLI